MKNTFKKLSALLIALVLVLSLNVAAYAEGSVDYKGGAEKFVFTETGKQLTDTDLFGNFKDVYPGDEIRQIIKIKNSKFGPKSVKIYMKAIAHDEVSNPLSENVENNPETVASMSDFLSQLYMTVTLGDKTIFSASPDELGGLKENVLLGEFPAGTGAELVVTLKVPAELGNEYADRAGEVDWVFTAEELPKSDKPTPPVTGDNENLLLYTVLMIMSAAGAAVVLRKKHN